jgi:hypothetical protein
MHAGAYYLLDTKRNVITPLEQNIEAYARKIAALAAWEELAPHSRPVQRNGRIMSYAPLGGLHHHYVRV